MSYFKVSIFFHQEGHKIQSEASSQVEQCDQVQGDLMMKDLFWVLQAAGFERSGDFRKWKGSIPLKKLSKEDLTFKK